MVGKVSEAALSSGDVVDIILLAKRVYYCMR